MSARNRKRSSQESAPGLGAEIESLRGLLRRALERAEQPEAGDPAQARELARWLEVLDSLSKSAARVGRLMINQRELEGDGLFGEAMRRAMDRAVRRLSKPGGEGGPDGPG